MSKEIAEVKAIIDEYISAGKTPKHYLDLSAEDTQKELIIIKGVITEYEAIKNAEPTKALEWLNYMQDICEEFLRRKELYMQFNFTTERAVETLKEITIIKQALLKAEKEHSALEVIKKKPYNSGLCINYLETNKHYPNMQDYEHYCMTIREVDRVNEEEFNLLKENVNENN